MSELSELEREDVANVTKMLNRIDELEAERDGWRDADNASQAMCAQLQAENKRLANLLKRALPWVTAWHGVPMAESIEKGKLTLEMKQALKESE